MQGGNCGSKLELDLYISRITSELLEVLLTKLPLFIKNWNSLSLKLQDGEIDILTLSFDPTDTVMLKHESKLLMDLLLLARQPDGKEKLHLSLRLSEEDKLCPKSAEPS